MVSSDSYKVLIIIPVYKQSLSSSEDLALLQCIKVFHKYPKCFVAPNDLNIKQYLANYDSFFIERFENKYFKNLDGYNKLLTSHKFYVRFSAYEFILIYQLDAFVFRDELKYWCDKNYDFIGAPFFEGFHLTKPGSKIIGVGNGGFSLRKVKTHFDLTKRFSFFKIYRRNIFSDLLAEKRYVNYIIFVPRMVFRVLYHFVRFKNRKYRLAEDYYWCIMIANNVKEYRVASVSDALAFAFERNPSDCMHLTNNQLPFGCHAWEKYSEFWSKYIPFDLKQNFKDVNC